MYVAMYAVIINGDQALPKVHAPAVCVVSRVYILHTRWRVRYYNDYYYYFVACFAALIRQTKALLHQKLALTGIQYYPQRQSHCRAPQ